MASFSTTVRQTTEMFQRKKTVFPRGAEIIEKVLNFKTGFQDLEKVLNLAKMYIEH